MATLHDRPFSKDYSGLRNQTVIAAFIAGICIASHEFMKRKRRIVKVEGLGSVESWEFGYLVSGKLTRVTFSLYQGRSWAKKPSPPISQGRPLSWIKQVINFPEEQLSELRGLDATVYLLFLRACTRFVLLHTFTTVPILLPIHIHFSDDSVSQRSMTRASISSLVGTTEGTRLLWIHIVLLFYITLSWIAALIWICGGAFHYREAQIHRAAEHRASAASAQHEAQYHPHLRYPFQSLPVLDDDRPNRGLRFRTVMVTNVPLHLRSEKELADYFGYYLSRPSAIPALSSQHGFFNKLAAVVYNHATRILEHLHQLHHAMPPGADGMGGAFEADTSKVPVISRVVIGRKMMALASLLDRREEVLQRLEAAHVKLAQKVLYAVKKELDKREGCRKLERRGSSLFKRQEDEEMPLDVVVDDEKVKEQLIRTLQPFVDEFGLRSVSASEKQRGHISTNYETVWEALHTLPRSALDGYQPLIQLSVFRGHTAPEIDYSTSKLHFLTGLITEQRARAIEHYSPGSTAFVTFSDPRDARRACRYLASHPDNPTNCVVQMAPSFEDLDWRKIMKSSFRAEFIKDWVVNVGIWAFTLSWLFPVSLFVGLVSIQNISAFLPTLANYLARHPWEEELLQSFIPTILVSLLTLLIPPILFLISKKAHTIVTLSALHDCIMTRYYKFLIINVLVFFCIGTAAVQSFLVGFAVKEANRNVLHILSDSFPSAGPFYVGWLIFTTSIHGGVELALLGLPLMMYPATRRSITPRKRNVGIRPRTFNYYYWLPNHLLVIHILFVFAVLNPLVMPFGLFYFTIEKIVIKNQFLHVYAKNYEENGQTILIRIIRYSLDGLVLAQAVFLAYMAVLRKEANFVLAAVLIALTTLTKIAMTRVCRTKFERDDLNEAMLICGLQQNQPHDVEAQPPSNHDRKIDNADVEHGPAEQSRTWRAPQIFPFNYVTSPPHAPRNTQRRPIPFENMDIHCAPVRAESAQVTEYSLNADSKNDEPGSKCSWVSPRPPHSRWNDESDPDHPYDNPHYNKPIEDSLWLPRNPCGVLDLDDTVDLHKALTSSSVARRSWIVGSQPRPSDPQSSHLERSTVSSRPLQTPITALQRRLSDNDVIASPPYISPWIPSADEVPQPKRRHSTYGWRGRDGHSPSELPTIHTYPTLPVGPSQSVAHPYLGPSPRSASLPIIRWHQYATSLDPELGDVTNIPPETQAHLEFLRQPSEHSVGTATISPAEAVMHEVMIEEQIVEEERIEQEAEDAEENTGKRPWWMRLFFSTPTT